MPTAPRAVFDDPVTQVQLIEAVKLIAMLVLGSIVSPIILSLVNRPRNIAAARKLAAEAAIEEANSAEKVKNLSADMVKTMYERVLQLTDRVTAVETEKELLRKTAEAEKEELRRNYEQVLQELSDRRIAGTRLQAQMTLLSEENARLHELIHQLQNAKTCHYVEKNCPFEGLPLPASGEK